MVFFCLHCTQMVSKMTFYQHQGLYDGLESESSKSFCGQLHSTMSDSVNQWTGQYQVDHQQVDELDDSIKGIESLSCFWYASIYSYDLVTLVTFHDPHPLLTYLARL